MTAAWRLVSSNPWSERTRNPAVPLAIAAHLALLGALLVSAILRVAPAPAEPFGPAVMSVILPPPPMEPDPVPPYDVKVPKGDFTKPALAREPVAEALPEVPSATPVPGVGEFDTILPGDLRFAGPGGPGGPDGTPDGTGRGLGPPDGEELDDTEAPLVPGGRITQPTLVHKVSPEYPRAARFAKVEGRVILQAVIARDGSVEDVEIISSSNRLLDSAAIEAVREWRYTPALLNGRPVRVTFRVSVEFVLE